MQVRVAEEDRGGGVPSEATKVASDEDLRDFHAYAKKEVTGDVPDEVATKKQPCDICGDGTVMKVRINEGEPGPRPKLGDTCLVNYEGRLTDMLDIALRDGDAVFDSNKGKPFEFVVGSGVIPGWSDAATTLKKGEKAKFVIKPEKAYGAKGDLPQIPADATLEFDIEMVSWESPDELEDVNENGSVLKKVLKKGVGWQQPTVLRGSDVVVHMIGRTKAQGGVSGEVFINTVAPCESVFINAVAPTASSKAVQFKIGEYPLEGVNDIVATMRRGEICEALIRPDKAFGATGSEGFASTVAPAGSVPPHTVIGYEIELVSWSEVEPLTEDGGVTIKKLDDPDGYGAPLPKPMDMAEVRLRYTLSLPPVLAATDSEDGAAVSDEVAGVAGVAGTVFDTKTVTFVVDEAAMCPGVDLAVKGMKVGQTAQITIVPEYGFGGEGGMMDGLQVPPHAVLQLEATLEEIISQSPTAAQLQEMEAAQRLAHCDEMKQRGNDWFKRKDYERANRRYTRALEAVESVEGFNGEEQVELADVDLEELEEKRQEKRLLVLVNRAQCHLSQKQYAQCAVDCREAMSPWDATRAINVKALYRLGCAELGVCTREVY
jgi:FK506-binding protein 4/5